MRETSLIEINLEAVDHNVRLVRSLVGPSCGLCAIVKADAYGLGAVRVSRRLVASGVDMLAVYSIEQAATLARAGLAAPILVLMPVWEIRRSDELHRALLAGTLHLVLHDETHFEQLDRLARRLDTSIPVHLEVDTGLTRGGAPPAEVIRILERFPGSPLRLAGIFTHFSDVVGDPVRTQDQSDCFDRTLATIERRAGAEILRGCVQHVASTAAILRHRRFHRSMVRFGLAWAGYWPEDLGRSDGAAPSLVARAAELRPCLTWSSRLVQVRRVEAGASVGYASRWTAARPSVLGLVPVGYADGFPRQVAEGSAAPKVAILPRGEAVEAPCQTGASPRFYAPVVGRVNMDQITVDLTDAVDQLRESTVGSSSLEIGVGARVELVSADPGAPNHLLRLADAAGTIPHDLLCHVAGLGTRAYLGESAGLAEREQPQTATAG